MFVPFILILVVGALLRGLYPKEWRVSDFFYALGDAFVIAGLIGISLDLYTSKFLIEKAADDLAGKLVGRGLPSELQSHIREITKTAFVRSNYVKEYRFVSASDSKFRLEETITFDVRNYSDRPEEYSPYVAEEIFFEPEFLHLEYGIEGQSPHCHDNSGLARLTKTEAKTKVKSVQGDKKITLLPFRENEKSVCKVLVKFSKTVPDQFTDVTNFGGATLGATLRLATIPQGYEFVCNASEHTEGSPSWYFKDSFVKGQHINVWWFRNPTV